MAVFTFFNNLFAYRLFTHMVDISPIFSAQLNVFLPIAKNALFLQAKKLIYLFFTFYNAAHSKMEAQNLCKNISFLAMFILLSIPLNLH